MRPCNGEAVAEASRLRRLSSERFAAGSWFESFADPGTIWEVKIGFPNPPGQADEESRKTRGRLRHRKRDNQHAIPS
jgi:hypothetical protein